MLQSEDYGPWHIVEAKDQRVDGEETKQWISNQIVWAKRHNFWLPAAIIEPGEDLAEPLLAHHKHVLSPADRQIFQIPETSLRDFCLSFNECHNNLPKEGRDTYEKLLCALIRAAMAKANVPENHLPSATNKAPLVKWAKAQLHNYRQLTSSNVTNSVCQVLDERNKGVKQQDKAIGEPCTSSLGKIKSDETATVMLDKDTLNQQGTQETKTNWFDDGLREKAMQKLVSGFASSGSMKHSTDIALRTKAESCLRKIEVEVNSWNDKWKLNQGECVQALSANCYMAYNPIPPLKENMTTIQKLLFLQLDNIQQTRAAIPFLAPVDTKILCVNDYYDIITNPMDFHTIRRKLSQNSYPNDSDFLRDMWLVFSNAWKYNHPETLVYCCASMLALHFLTELALPSCGKSMLYHSNCADLHGHVMKTIVHSSDRLGQMRRGKALKPVTTLSIESPDCSNPIQISGLKPLPEYAIRRFPGSKSAYFTFTLRDKLTNALRHVQLFRIITTEQGTTSLEEILMHQFGSSLASYMGIVIDEVAMKLYLASRSMNKTQPECPFPVVDRGWYQEFELTLGTAYPSGRRPMTAVLQKRRHIKVDLSSFQKLVECRLAIWPYTGTLLVYAINHDTENKLEEPKIGWLLQKKRADRVTFARFAASTLTGKPQIDQIRIMNRKVDGVPTMYAVFNATPKEGKERETAEPWLLFSLRATKTPEFGFELLDEQKIDPNPFSSWLPKSLPSLYPSAAVLGRVFHCMVIVCFDQILTHHIYGMHMGNRSIALNCALDMRLEFHGSSDCTFLFVIGNSLLLTQFNDALIATIDLEKPRYARQFKFYRICAHCGKREQKKRLNNGKRVANFKVCRECKKLKYHHDWQCHPCHYCSFECVKADWKKHKLIHQSDAAKE